MVDKPTITQIIHDATGSDLVICAYQSPEVKSLVWSSIIKRNDEPDRNVMLLLISLMRRIAENVAPEIGAAINRHSDALRAETISTMHADATPDKGKMN